MCIVTLTLDYVSQPLCVQQVFETCHFLFQLTHQAVVGVLIDHSVATDLFGTVSIPKWTKESVKKKGWNGFKM